MKLIFIKLLALLLLELTNSILSFARVKTTLDSLQTNKDITNLVLSLNPNLSTFEIQDTPKTYYDKLDERISKYKAHSVYKIDINRDSCIDLIIVHRSMSIDYLYRTENNKIMIRNVPKTSTGACLIPVFKNDKLLFNFYSVQYKSNPKKFDYVKSYKVTKLIYKDSFFIEYLPNSKRNQISEIQMEVTGCYGNCPAFVLKINKNGLVEFDPKPPFDYHEIIRKATKSFKADQVNRIFQLTEDIGFRKLKSRYSISAPDHATGYIKIKYSRNRLKEIEDYGLVGTFGLARLFEIAYEIYYEPGWKVK